MEDTKLNALFALVDGASYEAKRVDSVDETVTTGIFVNDVFISYSELRQLAHDYAFTRGQCETLEVSLGAVSLDFATYRMENPQPKHAHTTKLRDRTYHLVMDTLQKNSGNMTKTAAALGIDRRTLYRKMDRYRREGLV